MMLTKQAIMEKIRNCGITCSRCELDHDGAIDLEALDHILTDMESEVSETDFCGNCGRGVVSGASVCQTCAVILSG